ncbi:hypothetical protein MA16_Dca011951 [Dendrobium catenatum]|uniref:Uncharacterized protein n=1 Tax=Dendrobium catenatum TaxID=906689 RepID=A0A2I0WDS7_9ASPA|nr:hypothetical protein MA16_Dca011951 [Dendrobium catenatum]
MLPNNFHDLSPSRFSKSGFTKSYLNQIRGATKQPQKRQPTCVKCLYGCDSDKQVLQCFQAIAEKVNLSANWNFLAYPLRPSPQCLPAFPISGMAQNLMGS